MARRCCRVTSRFTGKTHASMRDALISTIFLFVCLLFPLTTEAGLYTASDQIVVLTPDNVDAVLFNSTASVVVEFYASWCGHCIGFSPVWKSLARDIKEWKPAVDLAAMDCAEEDNRKVCSKFGIKGYPSLKFFHAYSKNDSVGQSFKVFMRDVRGLRQQIIQKIETHEEPWPPACPPLETASEAEVDNFFETNNVDQVALIFENANSYVGREVTLDLLQYENVAVRRVLNTEEGLVAKLGVTDYPSCYLYYPGGNFTRLKVQIEARSFYSYALQRLPGVVRAGKPLPVTSDLTYTTAEQWRPFNRSRVYMADLESALHYSLRVELTSSPVISREALSALRHYISVLAKYFPGRPVVKNLLTSVNSWLQRHGNAELSYSALRDALDNTAGVPDAVLPEGVRWVGCQGSKPHFRRYPCSMWTLFHVLTVQAKANGSDPQEVLQAMRAYIHSFFGCRACATHFENMAEESMAQVGTLSAAVLWLWSGHNRVNNRLAGALSEDPHFPKLQWPPPDLCPRCHGVKRSGEHTWNQEEVLPFLLSYFSSQHLLPDYLEEEAKLLAQQKKSQEAHRLEKQQQQQEAQRGAERRAREAQDSQAQPPPPPEEEEEDEEEEEVVEVAAAGVVRTAGGGGAGAEVGGKTLEPPPWVRPAAEVSEAEVAPHRRPSIVGHKLREPREDIVDLDSFVQQHYKAKALRAAAASSSRIKRRSLQRKEEPVVGGPAGQEPELGLQPVEPEDLAGLGGLQRKRLQKRGLTGQYTGSDEELELQLYPHHYRGRWISALSVGFSRLDISLCVLLYFLSAMCLLGMYLYFKMRLRLCRAKVALP